MERVCEYCGEEIQERGNSVTCKTCYDINESYIRLKRQKYRQKRKDEALCLNCGSPLDCDGVNCSKCKEILTQRTKEWYKANKQKAKEYQKEYMNKNRNKMNKYRREYYQANKEKIKAQNLEYYHKKKVTNN